LPAASNSRKLSIRNRLGLSFALLHGIFCALVFAAPLHAQSQTVLASRDDAYVARDAAAREWAVGSNGLELVVGFGSNGQLAIKRLWHPDDGRLSSVAADVEVEVTLGDENLKLQESGTTVAFLRADAVETESGVRLNLTFEHRASHALITRSYAAYPGTPTFETWMNVEMPPGPSALAVSKLTGWRLTMAPGVVRWLNGLRGETSSDPGSSTFDIQGGDVGDDTHIEIGSTRRSSEAFVPIIFADSDDGRFYGGVIWSGAWRITVDRAGDTMTVNAGFPDISIAVTPGKPVEFPHSFFGLVGSFQGLEAAAIHRFIMRGIRQGRPFQPLVTYNTWFARGTRLFESEVAQEIYRASSLGVELFVLDAGWYEGSGIENQWDFTSGLGSWRVDAEKFPSGLRAMAELAHEDGMKFGLWFEPERVARSLVGQPGMAQEEWLATQQGSYGDERSAQLCLASDEARQWVFDRMVQVLDEVRPDYLKWDNNFWLNCDRDGHGHGSESGNYAHVVALYGMLGELRRRYPDMLIENVSGGGNRLDFGMLAYSDVGWMDDRTSPSSLVRHNLEGLTLAFPPAYLLSFVIDSDQEPIVGASDFGQIMRSRMPGILGLTYAFQILDPQLSGELRREIEFYKRVRGTIAQSHAFLLGPQAAVNGEGWDALEELSDDRQNALLFGFKGSDGSGRLRVKPINLIPDATYYVSSFDRGFIAKASGSDLMIDGVELAHGDDDSRAHVIILSTAP
jgi:alpha-galactosidase